MRQPAKLTPIAVILLAGMTAVTACSNDLPTEPAEKPGAAAARPGPSLAAAASNDDFDNATVVSALPFTDTVNTADATTAGDDPDCVGNGPTVWYRFTPSENTRININTFGSDYDTSISAYTGSRGNLNQLACNDDAGGSTQSSLTLDLVGGETVFFMAGAFASGPGGNLVVNIDLAPPPLEFGLTIDPVGSVDASTGVATIGGTVTCSRQAFVSLDGQLLDRIGRIRVEAFFFAFVECDGITRWEAEVAAQNAFLVGGPVEIAVNASAFDGVTGEPAFAQESATVRLRGKKN
jgi:hypothetical protein